MKGTVYIVLREEDNLSFKPTSERKPRKCAFASFYDVCYTTSESFFSLKSREW